MIRVVYPNGIHDTVTPEYLDYLIAENRISRFLRSGGWAVIGRDRIRRSRRSPYQGEEKRSGGP